MYHLKVSTSGAGPSPDKQDNGTEETNGINGINGNNNGIKPKIRMKPIDPRIYARQLAWDWSKQRWHGCYLANNSHRCNYWDLSEVRAGSSKYYCNKEQLRSVIKEALLGDKHNLERVLITSPVLPRRGDLIQVGKSKNRGLFIMGECRLHAVTQVLGGNGFGEVPLSFIADASSSTGSAHLPVNYWTYKDHPILGIIPIARSRVIAPLKQSDSPTTPACNPCSCACHNQEDLSPTRLSGDEQEAILIEGKLFRICKGTNRDHPYFFVDLTNHEFFSLPVTVTERFQEAEKKIIESLEMARRLQNKNSPADPQTNNDPSKPRMRPIILLKQSSADGNWEADRPIIRKKIQIVRKI